MKCKVYKTEHYCVYNVCYTYIYIDYILLSLKQGSSKKMFCFDQGGKDTNLSIAILSETFSFFPCFTYPVIGLFFFSPFPPLSSFSSNLGGGGLWKGLRNKYGEKAITPSTLLRPWNTISSLGEELCITFRTWLGPVFSLQGNNFSAYIILVYSYILCCMWFCPRVYVNNKYNINNIQNN